MRRLGAPLEAGRSIMAVGNSISSHVKLGGCVVVVFLLAICWRVSAQSVGPGLVGGSANFSAAGRVRAGRLGFCMCGGAGAGLNHGIPLGWFPNDSAGLSGPR